MTSDAGALLRGATDRAIRRVDRFAACFTDRRRPEWIEHKVSTLVGKRIFGIALGYEDLIDHDGLRHDPIFAVLAGKRAARCEDCAPVAGKSTLNWLALSKPEPSRYHKIAHDAAGVDRLLVDLFIEAHKSRRSRLSSISMRPTPRCTVIRRGGSFAAIMIVIAICRFTFSAACEVVRALGGFEDVGASFERCH